MLAIRYNGPQELPAFDLFRGKIAPRSVKQRPLSPTGERKIILS